MAAESPGQLLEQNYLSEPQRSLCSGRHFVGSSGKVIRRGHAYLMPGGKTCIDFCVFERGLQFVESTPDGHG